MIFGPTPLAEARGAILAHTLRLPGRVLKKGSVLDADGIDALRAAGHAQVVAARLEPGDIGEDEAADRLAAALAGPLVARSRGATGRVNLIADSAGLLTLDARRIERINALDEALTVATLPNHQPVAAREMLATIKVIPFAVAETTLAIAEALARQGAPPVAVRPFRPLRVGLVLTELPGTKDSVMEGAVAVTAARIDALCGTLLPPERVRHDTPPIADALHRLRRQGADLLLVAGASAVVDRRDVAPAAIVRAGGEITHFGMPVDPGNLICVGRIDTVPAIVLPGCARSPKLNGIDWVLYRLFAGLPVGGAEIMAMGVGGLLKEVEHRPLPRADAPRQAVRAPPRRGRRIAALILAAGRSRRMAPRNKLLLQDATGTAMVARVADHVLASHARPVIVVTGHDAPAIEAALAGRPVRLAHAADYADGLSASLRAGLAALPPEVEGVLVCLGDMPLVTTAMLDRLLAAFDPEEGRAIVLPTFRGKQGNPMLWAAEFFTAMRAVSGDVGARHLLGTHAERVAEVEMADDAVLRDFDTPEALAERPGFG